MHLYFPSKKLTLISVLNYGDTENVLINHLLLVIPMSYPCHYTNLCPHKPHKHTHTHTHTHTKLTFGLFILSVGIRDDEHHRCGYQLCLDWFIPTSESIFPWIRHSADPHCGGNRGNIFFCPYTMITYNLLLQWPKLSIRWHQWVVFVLCVSVWALKGTKLGCSPCFLNRHPGGLDNAGNIVY